MNKRLLAYMLAVVAGLGMAACPANGEEGELFAVSASIKPAVDGVSTIQVRLEIKEPGHIYKDSIKVGAQGLTLELINAPEPVQINDPARGATEVYDRDTIFEYRTAAIANPVELTVKYQGCTDSTCFMPQSVSFNLAPGDPMATVVDSPDAPAKSPAQGWLLQAGMFKVVAQSTGYMKPGKFISFLTGAGKAGELTILLILLGGLALNLTPCVLPMIPVNIAIIGAGAQAGSRRRGFALGAAYGFGMAVTYGILGVLVVLTGARFGSLQSLPAFNFAIGALFLVLALGMFDVMAIDFSRWQSGKATDGGNKHGFAVALVMGSVAAVLAGACVAPVVIAVLLYSADLYNAGHAIGLAAPFLLGVGMALPWPLAGAGLSFLPRPGRWMIRVKYAFGVIILIMAAYYGVEGVKLVRGARARSEHPGWLTSLDSAFEQARAQNKPVLIDFAADWCKNCAVMDATTFKDALVLKELERFVKVRFAADNQRDPAVKEALDYFNVLGLPTYVILEQTKGLDAGFRERPLMRPRSPGPSMRHRGN